MTVFQIFYDFEYKDILTTRNAFGKELKKSCSLSKKMIIFDCLPNN